MINKWDSVDRGCISEMTVELHLTKLGFTVLRPNRPRHYDLLVETLSGFSRVQVKTARYDKKPKEYDSSWRTKLTRSVGQSEKLTKYGLDDIDVFAIVNENNIHFIKQTYDLPKYWQRPSFPPENAIYIFGEPPSLSNLPVAHEVPAPSFC